MVSFNPYAVTGFLVASFATLSIAQSDNMEQDPATNFVVSTTTIPALSDSLPASVSTDPASYSPTSVLVSVIPSTSSLQDATFVSAMSSAMGSDMASVSLTSTAVPTSEAVTVQTFTPIAVPTTSIPGTQTLASASAINTLITNTAMPAPTETVQAPSTTVITLNIGKSTSAVASAKPSGNPPPSLVNNAGKVACGSILGLSLGLSAFFFGF